LSGSIVFRFVSSCGLMWVVFMYVVSLVLFSGGMRLVVMLCKVCLMLFELGGVIGMLMFGVSFFIRLCCVMNRRVMGWFVVCMVGSSW